MGGRARKSRSGNVKNYDSENIRKEANSTRIIYQLLKSKGFQVSHVAVYIYLRNNLGVLPYKPQLQPKLTEKQKLA